ncbi:MAG: dehydrogenase, partial [Verrucomicrobia bacterium]|nr:dehydrogenase [Verrucomicrobiota bacterium]
THSKVGKPGAADSERVPLNAGVFRYHPTKKRFELFSEGTSNPWGVDFDALGQCHIEACVIPHFYHMIQGARYIRQGGSHFNPHTYGEIDTIADHFHYSGSQGPHAANGRSDSAGGGHAHAGLMIYQGDSWPEQYRGKAFMNNIHGQRFNMDILERRGSGFVARHGQDFVNFRDKWSQILHIISDQDGSAYAIDWYDANQCHHGRTDGHDRSNGRIFKIVYNNQPVSRVDLSAATDEELVRLQLHPNDFNARHARRLLQERGPNPKVHQLLLGWLGLNGSKGGRLPKGWLPPDAETQQLRLLWTLHACEGLNPEIGMKLLRSPHEYVRAWAIQLMLEDKKVPDGLLDKMASMARSDRSPVVRLYIAAALQRVPPADRMNTLLALLSHAEDTTDHNLPFMYWYAAEPLVAQGADQGLKLLQQSKIPKVREYIARRMTAAGKSDRLSAF